MTGFLMLLAAGALMFAFYYPRPKSFCQRAEERLIWAISRIAYLTKSYAERAGEWVKGRIGR